MTFRPLALAFIVAACAPLTTADIHPDADTFVFLKNIGQVAQGDKPMLMVKSDNPPAALDRIAVLRFTVAADTEVSAAALLLTRKIGKPANDPSPWPTLELYGVADGAEELSFDGASWSAGTKNCAVDQSDNRLRATLLVDGDEATEGLQPLATASTASPIVAFASEALDAYLRDRAGQSVAFVVRALPGEARVSTKPVMFHSLETTDGPARRPRLTFSGSAQAIPAEPSASADAENRTARLPEGAVPGTRIHFEPDRGADLTLNAVVAPTIRYSFYDQDGRRYNLPTMGGADDPVLSMEQAREGDHSLRIHCGPTEGDDRDRVEFRLKSGSTDEHPLRFGQDRWYGWSIYIDPESQPAPAGKWLHVGQLWQPSTVGAAAARVGWGIPGALSFLPNRESWDMDVVLKSDGSRGQFSLGSLEPGRWHDIVVNVKLSHSKDAAPGHYRAWVNDSSVVNEVIHVGNHPRVDGDFEAADAMDIRMGLYRKSQERTQTFYLDEIWFDDKAQDPAMAQLPVGRGDRSHASDSMSY